MWDSKVRSFSLFEILIALLLVSSFYFFTFSSLENKNIGKKQLTLESLKKELFSYPFEKKIMLKCIKEDLSCFVFLDGVLQEKKIPPFFKEIPLVYSYNKELKQIEFLEFQTQKLDRYDIVFELECTKSGFCDEYIIEFENQVLLYSNLEEIVAIESINDVDSYFENKINEVKNAF